MSWFSFAQSPSSNEIPTFLGGGSKPAQNEHEGAKNRRHLGAEAFLVRQIALLTLNHSLMFNVVGRRGHRDEFFQTIAYDKGKPFAREGRKAKSLQLLFN
jgi:hypothetical protein